MTALRSRPSRQARALPTLFAVAGLGVAAAAATAGCDGLASAAGETIDVDQLPTLTLEEDLRIGSVHDPNVGFSRIGEIEVTPDGTLYLMELQDRQVRVYDAQGALLRKIGRRGKGPGEFESPIGLQVVGDTVAVFEPFGNVRVSLFTTAGELIGTVPAQGVVPSLNVAGVRVRLRPGKLRPDGMFEATDDVLVSPSATDLPDSVLVPNILFDQSGAPADTSGVLATRMQARRRAAGITISVAPPFGSQALRTPAGLDTVVVQGLTADATEGTFTVSRVTQSGDTTYQRRFRYTPRAIAPAYRDSLMQFRLRIYEGQVQPGDLPALRSALEAAMQLPEFFPPVSQVRIGSDGAVWLARESVPGNGLRWIILNADGTPHGELVMTTAVRGIGAEGVWVVERDQLDVPWLVRYRIVGRESLRSAS